MHGDIFVGIALAGCLIVDQWAITVLSIFLALLLIFSTFRSIWHSIINFNPRLFRTKRGIYYNVKLSYPILLFPLILWHADSLSGLETPLKSVLVSYILVMNMDRHRWLPLVYGVAIGAVVALAHGVLEFGVFGIDRPGGETNRFGMV